MGQNISHSASMAEALKAAFARLFGSASPALFFAPGRVNLMGEYTDFNGGHVFPCAISLGTWAAAAPRSDGRFRFHSLNFPQKGIIETDDAALPGTQLVYDRRRYGWANYPLGVPAVLARRGHALPHGLDVVFAGNLPTGAGLSSSASIEVLTAVLADELFHLGLGRKDLALLAQEAENAFVGMQCGIMDQFAIACGKKDHALLLHCGSLACRHVPLTLDGYRVLIANTNKERSLTESKYNERRAECETALTALRRLRPVGALGDLTETAFDAAAALLPPSPPLRRARHVVRENQRTLRAVEALERHDPVAFGRLMNASHASLRDDFEVSGPELDHLADCIRRQPGVLGARMTGAGFGGCVVALVPAALPALSALRNAVATAYAAATGRQPDFYDVSPVDGAARCDD